MKTFKQLFEEVTKHEPIYHAKKMKIETPTFSGHAHFKFEKELGKYGNHEYRVSFKGITKGKDGYESDTSDTSTHRMIVHNGTHGPFKYEIDGRSSNDLKTILHKVSPRFVTLDDLKNATQK